MDATPPSPAPPSGQPRTEPSRRSAWLLLGATLAVGLVLRLWDIDYGLPFVYNSDELRYFVPDAVRYSSEGYVPSRMGGNPPGFAYGLHAVYLAVLGGPSGILGTWASSPETLYLIGRIVAAFSGVLAAWVLYAAATRLFDRRAGLVAALLMAVAFLPLVYSRRALADAPQLLPMAVSLLGAAGILRRGRWVDYALAGAGLGLAVGTKYLAGVAALPLAAAIGRRLLDRAGWRRTLTGAALAGGAALVGLFLVHPFLLLRWGELAANVPGLGGGGEGGSPKVGIGEVGGVAYYLLVFTWGIGWVAAGLGATGAVLLLLRDRRAALMLIPAVIFLILFMGARPRAFSRYLLPAFPLVILLAAHAASEALRWAGRLRLRLRRIAVVAGVVALVAQSLLHVVHHLRVGGKTDTREIAAAWMRQNIPKGDAVLLEPMWIPVDQDSGDRNPRAGEQVDGSPWDLVDGRAMIEEAGLPLGRTLGGGIDVVGSWRADLVDLLEEQGVCWVVTSSNQRGRVIRTPELAPDAAAFYRELDQRARVVHTVVRPRGLRDPHPHQREWNGTFYDLTLERPGPQVDVHRLDACPSRSD